MDRGLCSDERRPHRRLMAAPTPKAKGVWRGDERGGVLVKDEPVVHCYTTPADIQADRSLADLGGFCRKMDAKLATEKLVSWSPTSTSPSAISERSRR